MIAQIVSFELNSPTTFDGPALTKAVLSAGYKLQTVDFNFKGRVVEDKGPERLFEAAATKQRFALDQSLNPDTEGRLVARLEDWDQAQAILKPIPPPKKE